MSTLRVNNVTDLAGASQLGSIIQVVQSTRTSTASATGYNWGDMLEATITPGSTNNKILVMIQANIGSNVGYDMKARLTRNGTAIHIGDTASNRPRVTTTITQTYHSTNQYAADQAIINYLDSPATTSAVTYKLQFASYNTYVVYINRTGSDQNSTEYDGRGASSIILMEVKG